MPLVETRHITAAWRLVDPLDLRKGQQFAEVVFDAQPNLLASLLVLPRFGVRDRDIDIALTILFVCFFASRDARPEVRKVTVEDQDRCLERLVARQHFAHGLPPERQPDAAEDYAREHDEPLLLAFVLSYLQQHDLHQVRDEPEKHLMLSMLTMVDSLTLALHDVDGVANRQR